MSLYKNPWIIPVPLSFHVHPLFDLTQFSFYTYLLSPSPAILHFFSPAPSLSPPMSSLSFTYSRFLSIHH